MRTWMWLVCVCLLLGCENSETRPTHKIPWAVSEQIKVREFERSLQGKQIQEVILTVGNPGYLVLQFETGERLEIPLRPYFSPEFVKETERAQ